MTSPLKAIRGAHPYDMRNTAEYGTALWCTWELRAHTSRVGEELIYSAVDYVNKLAWDWSCRGLFSRPLLTAANVPQLYKLGSFQRQQYLNLCTPGVQVLLIALQRAPEGASAQTFRIRAYALPEAWRVLARAKNTCQALSGKPAVSTLLLDITRPCKVRHFHIRLIK